MLNLMLQMRGTFNRKNIPCFNKETQTNKTIYPSDSKVHITAKNPEKTYSSIPTQTVSSGKRSLSHAESQVDEKMLNISVET